MKVAVCSQIRRQPNLARLINLMLASVGFCWFLDRDTYSILRLFEI
jgi:hypothetical protein